MRNLLLLLFIGMFLTTYSQEVDDIVWQQCFGTDKMDNPNCIEKTSEGYILGINIETDAPGISNYHDKSDIWIVKTDSVGNILWERCYGGSEGDGVNKIVAINEDSYYIFGGSWSKDGDVQNNRPGNLWVVKIDATGNILWENNYGSVLRKEDDRDALLTPDGGLLIMCRIMCSGGDISTYYGSNDIWLCKIDTLGKIEWENTLGNYGLDNAINMILTSDTTIMIAGGHYESGGMITCLDLGTYGPDVWIVEIDLQGNILRQFCYGGSHSDLGFDIVEVKDGYVFAALTNSNDQDVSGFHGIPGDESTSDIWVCKIDFHGNILWQRCLGGSKSECPVYIINTTDNGCIVFGDTYSHDGDVTFNHSLSGRSDIWMIKLDSTGNLEWEHCFGSRATERFWGVHAVLKKSDDNFVILGRSQYADGDVECDLYGWPDEDAWALEIKDCSNYMPLIPIQPTGPDTLCYTTDSTSIYEINTAAGAWGYEWKIEPEEAGTILQDTLSAYITWNQQYEGEVAVSVRSFNDCGNSDWSEVKTTYVYNCVGIEEINTAGYALQVYPNPAKSSFEIRCSIFDIQEGIIEIYDVFGKKVKEIILPKGKTKAKVNVENWRKGLYLIKVSNEKNYYGIRKILIQ